MKSGALSLGASFRDLRSEMWMWFDIQDSSHSEYFLSPVPRLRQLGKSACSPKGTGTDSDMEKVCSQCLGQRFLGTLRDIQGYRFLLWSGIQLPLLRLFPFLNFHQGLLFSFDAQWSGDLTDKSLLPFTAAASLQRGSWAVGYRAERRDFMSKIRCKSPLCVCAYVHTRMVCVSKHEGKKL